MARNRKRPGRVRTERNNRREALKLSTMAPEDYNVRPNETMSIACPDCRTWRRIMGTYDLKIREHCISDKVAEGQTHERCPGSNQAVDITGIDVRRWQARQDRLLREAMPQDNRRAAQQFYKPLPAPAAPVSRIKAEVTLDSTRQSYLAHRKGCTRCVGGQHCTDGGILARRYVLALDQEPARREALKRAGAPGAAHCTEADGAGGPQGAVGQARRHGSRDGEQSLCGPHPGIGLRVPRPPAPAGTAGHGGARPAPGRTGQAVRAEEVGRVSSLTRTPRRSTTAPATPQRGDRGRGCSYDQPKRAAPGLRPRAVQQVTP
ncbi:hypothetical protein O1M63_26505 [Streptomyces mirabilis]|nr:hypothetical protein [Streptomyces mirabilis]